MGAKQSTIGAKHAWPGKKDDTYDVAVLERSTDADRAQNSLGLPDDLLALIATFLSVRDMPRVALVCKTWRRVALKEAVWRVFGLRMGVEPREDSTWRIVVVRAVSDVLAADFCLPPPTATVPVARKDRVSVSIGLLSPTIPNSNSCPFGAGAELFCAGTSSLMMRFVFNGELEEDPMFDHTQTKVVHIDGCVVEVEVRDTSGRELGTRVRNDCIRDCDGFLLCSTFGEPDTMRRLAALYEQVKEAKELHSVPVVVVRTMADLGLAFHDRMYAMRWIKEHGAGLISTSSLTGLNVKEAFVMLVRMWLAVSEKKGRK